MCDEELRPDAVRFGLRREVGERYLALGVAASALDIFEALGLWELAVVALQIMGKGEKVG